MMCISVLACERVRRRRRRAPACDTPFGLFCCSPPLTSLAPPPLPPLPLPPPLVVVGFLSLLRARGHTDQLVRMAYGGMLLFGVTGIMRAVRPAYGLEMMNLLALLFASTAILSAAAAEWRWAGPSFGRWVGYLFCCGCGEERAARIRKSKMSRRLSKGCGECGGFLALFAFLSVSTIYAQTGPDLSAVVTSSNVTLLTIVVIIFVLAVVPVLVIGALFMSIIGYRVPEGKPMLKRYDRTRQTRTEWTCLIFTACVYILVVMGVGAVDLQCINGRARWPPFMILRALLVIFLTQLASHYCAFLQFARAQENKLATFLAFWPQCGEIGRNFLCSCGPRCVPMVYTVPEGRGRSDQQRAHIHRALTHMHESPLFCCTCGLVASPVGTTAAMNALFFGEVPMNELSTKLEAVEPRAMTRFERSFARCTTQLGESQEDQSTLLVSVANEVFVREDNVPELRVDTSHIPEARKVPNKSPSKLSPRSPRQAESAAAKGVKFDDEAADAVPALPDAAAIGVGDASSHKHKKKHKKGTLAARQSRKSMALMTLPTEYEVWGDMEVALIDTDSSEDDGAAVVHTTDDEASEIQK